MDVRERGRAEATSVQQIPASCSALTARWRLFCGKLATAGGARVRSRRPPSAEAVWPQASSTTDTAWDSRLRRCRSSRTRRSISSKSCSIGAFTYFMGLRVCTNVPARVCSKLHNVKRLRQHFRLHRDICSDPIRGFRIAALEFASLRQLEVGELETGATVHPTRQCDAPATSSVPNHVPA